MNPLKFYLYKQLGMPIVTTPVKNLGSFEGLVYCSDGTVESFVEGVENALRRNQHSLRIWDRRGRRDLWSNRVKLVKRVCGI